MWLPDVPIGRVSASLRRNAPYPAIPGASYRHTVKSLTEAVDAKVVNAARTLLPLRRPLPRSPLYRLVTSALSALFLVAALAAAIVLVAYVVDRSRWDPYGIGHGGWKPDLCIGLIGVAITGVLAGSAFLFSRSQGRAPLGERYAGAIVAVALLPGLWLGISTSHPIRAALIAASGSASQDIPDSQTSAAVAQLAKDVGAPRGWSRTGKTCTQGYVCWASPQADFFTRTQLVALLEQFGVKLGPIACIGPFIAANGRDSESCSSTGRTSGYEVAMILDVRRGIPGLTGTEIALAPVRHIP